MGVAGVVLLKELRETLRDRRTLLVMIVVPVLLYPALFITLEQLMLFGQRSVEARPAAVALAGRRDADLEAFLRTREQLRLVEGGDFGAADVRAKRLEAVAVVGDESEGGATGVRIFFDAASDRSQRARSELLDALLAWSDTLLDRRLDRAGLPPDFARPLVVSDSSVALPRERSGYVLGRFLPLLLVVITLLGAFYPAIDMAAGEKERGTLETLLTSPARPAQILAGKFLAVTLIALMAAALNLGSMLLTLRAGLFQAVEQLDMDVALPAAGVALIFAALVPLAVLFAGVFLGVAVRAHSFKEAQNSLTPVYMLALVPAMLPVVPGIEFGAAIALVPVAGVALLFREAMAGEVAPVAAMLALASSGAYAAAALAFAARAFGREDILFGVAEAEPVPAADGWTERLRHLRGRVGPVPTPGQGLLFMAAIAALYFYLGRTLLLRWGTDQPLLGLLAAQWILLFLPTLAFVRIGGFDARATLALRRPAARELGAALLIIAGGIPVGLFMAWLQSRVLEIPEEYLRVMRELLLPRGGRDLSMLLLVVALTPAICEELVFRGVLLSSVRRGVPAAAAILLTALVFGAFHLSLGTAIRFLPTAWLGLLLALVVWRTRSIFPSMLMHFVNNATVVLLTAWPAASAWMRDDGAPPLAALPVGLLLLAAGLYLLGLERPALRGGSDSAH